LVNLQHLTKASHPKKIPSKFLTIRKTPE